MHPHLPNQTLLLPAQVDGGAHHSGYRKSRQGPSQLTKSEVPFACPLLCVPVSPSRLSPVVRVRRLRRPDQITSHHNPSHRIAWLFSAPSLIPPPAASVLACLPHSLHENQLHQLDKGTDKTHLYTRTLGYIIPSAQTDESPSPTGQGTTIISREVGSHQPSSSSQKGCPGYRQGTSACHLAVKSLVHFAL